MHPTQVLVKIASELMALKDINQSVLVDTVDLLPHGIYKVSEFVDSKARSGNISFRDRDRILLELSGKDHAKMACVEASLASNRLSHVEKQAAARVSQVDEFTRFLSS